MVIYPALMTSAHSHRSNRFLRSRAAKAILLVVSILSLEVAARLAYTVVITDTSSDWYVLSRDVGWTRRPDFDGADLAGSQRRFAANGLLVSDARQIAESDRPRVVFIGDSTTYGYGVETPLTFVERLDAALRGIDAINLGVPGYTSVQGYRSLLRDAVPLEPALIVFSFNYNDRRYVLRPADVDGSAHFARQHTAHMLRHFFVYRSVRRVLIPPDGPEDRAVRLDLLATRVEPDRYRRLLEKVAALADAHDADLLFLMFGDNPAHTRELDRGMARLAGGKLQEGIQDLELAVSRGNDFSDIARLQLAHAYRLAERTGDADSVLARVRPVRSLHGGRPLYTDELYHDIMRGVARRLAVPLIDAAELLDRAPSRYIDSVHLTAGGHAVVAGILTRHIAERMESSIHSVHRTRK